MSGWLLWLLALLGLSLFLAALVRQWTHAFRASLSLDQRPAEPVRMSVLVPARNEAGRISLLLQDLAAQAPVRPDEVIVVDDASQDGTLAQARSMATRWPALRVLSLQGAHGKKAALEAGMAVATHPVVLFTDADVRCGPGRLAAFGRAWAFSAPDLLLGPVFLREAHGLMGRYQREEQAVLLGVGAGSALCGTALLANGANLAVRRSVFEAMGGYAADRHWASGDDMFLLRRVQRSGGRIAFVAEPAAAVEVEPAAGVLDWARQRLRWAGKLRAYPAPGAFAFGVLAIGLPWALAWSTILVLDRRIGDDLGWSWALLVLGWSAWLGPALGLVQVAKEMQGLRHRPMGSLVALLGMAFSAPLIAAIALVVRPRWKGRRT
ncbi:MAG TPA: glycosyltransferase [Flavobacteriales bacterium]|nr:glycosyltransferase [Flavobacteriales bacterium]HMR27654.1 glycosyltransferase [Flavobacteriales bacterium]